MHHVCVGEICKRVAEMYNEVYKDEYDKLVNVDLVVSVALIHDIGKLREISVNLENGDMEYSNESGLTTHITNGTILIDRIGRELGVTEEKIMEMRHLIESHHGELEYGSPQKPHMLEAHILAHADMLDAMSWKFKRVYDKVEVGESEKVWGGSGMDLFYRNSGVIRKENK